MASRSSGGSGLVITVAILGVASLALFVLTIVFLSKYQATNRQLTELNSNIEEIVRTDERGSDVVARIKQAAKADRKSVVGYLADSMKTAMQRVTGSPTDTVTDMNTKLDAKIGNASVLGALADRQAESDQLSTKLRQADEARTTALADLQNEVERTKKLIDGHNKTVATLNADIGKYRDEVETNRTSVQDAKKFMDQEIEKCRESMASMQATKDQSIRDLQNENLQLKEQISKINAAQGSNLLKPKSEEALVDGEIIQVNQGLNTVTIGRGMDSKIILGMSFSVYSDATNIRPDKNGNYPRPKATIEVISVGENSSTCRITEEVKGNPIVRGDVVANAIYDPNKVYTFLVYGNFDTNGDGVATPQEAGDIKAMISSWGGKVAEDLAGNVDFLILGERPPLPARPGVNDPYDLVKEWMRLNDMAQKYDKLFDTASATSLPVLNQNRLYTLIGRKAGSK